MSRDPTDLIRYKTKQKITFSYISYKKFLFKQFLLLKTKMLNFLPKLCKNNDKSRPFKYVQIFLINCWNIKLLIYDESTQHVANSSNIIFLGGYLGWKSKIHLGLLAPTSTYCLRLCHMWLNICPSVISHSLGSKQCNQHLK